MIGLYNFYITNSYHPIRFGYMMHPKEDADMDIRSFENHLTQQLIPFWNRMEDRENGGFYGYADEHGFPKERCIKGSILNSRILWFYSASYNLLKKSELLSKADHAFAFLRDRFYDSVYKGVFWSVAADGTPCDTAKHTYCQAFAVYALSEYYMASNNRTALELAYDLFYTIEEKCRDNEGYLEAFGRDFSPVSNDKLSENGVIASRTMNTLLHVLEAYTVLYAADGSSHVKTCICNILTIFKTKIYNESKKSCEVFFDMEYHPLISLESYGHNIEASWLIKRACDIIGDEACYEEMLPVIDGLADGAFCNGIDTKYNAMNNECENGIVNVEKIWWVQAEAVTGFYNAFMMHPEKDLYKTASENIWKFIQTYVIDQYTGEWFENTDPECGAQPGQALAHPWKCPYHNGRMCIEMIRRLR
jgi:mannobiose 2-epimerase